MKKMFFFILIYSLLSIAYSHAIDLRTPVDPAHWLKFQLQEEVPSCPLTGFAFLYGYLSDLDPYWITPRLNADGTRTCDLFKIIIQDQNTNSFNVTPFVITDSNTPQFKIVHTTNTNYTTFGVDSSGYLTIIPSGGSIYIGNAAAGTDYSITIDGEDSDLILTHDEDNGIFLTNQEIRTTSSLYIRHYHLPLASFNPGASGTTWTSPDSNLTGGWDLDTSSETLEPKAVMHADWDGNSNPFVSIRFTVNDDNTGGDPNDTVDIKIIFYYKEAGDTSCKTQTQEVATVVGQCAQWTDFETIITLDYDYPGNVVDSGDGIGMILNLETDTSEVDDITICCVGFNYYTSHIGIEANDL